MKSNKKGNDKEIIVTIQNYWFMYIWILLIGIVSFIMPKNVVERQGIRYAQWGKFMALIAVVPLIVSNCNGEFIYYFDCLFSDAK